MCDHEHTEHCISCENSDKTKKFVQQCFNSLSFSDEQTREEVQYGIENSFDKVVNWRKDLSTKIGASLICGKK